MQADDKSRVQFETASLEYLFPSPIMHFDWPESETLNRRLKEIIFEIRAKSSGVVKTNRGGWQSEANLQTWKYSEIEELADRIVQLAQEYVARTLGSRDDRFKAGWSIRAWANVNQKGNFNRTHDHVGRHSFFSGVYYVDVGDIDEHGRANGRTVFEDWTCVATNISDDPNPYQRDFKMIPKNGRMLFFPASLMHSVETYGGDRPRITIAFNLFHPGFTVARLTERERSSNWMWRNFRGLMILRKKIPEKLFGLALIPRVIASTPVPRPMSLRGLVAYLATSVDHAFALASGRFEARDGA
jgi:uncharacterized protein (TIGR02466 family)